MRIQRITTNQLTGSIIGDVYADIGSEWRIQDVRLDECMSDFADCLIHLDGGGSYTFHDLKGGRESRLRRDGSKVVVQLHTPNWPDDASCRLDYPAFRTGVLTTLCRYRDQLDRMLPEHPEARAFRRKLGQVEAQLGANDRSLSRPH